MRREQHFHILQVTGFKAKGHTWPRLNRMLIKYLCFSHGLIPQLYYFITITTHILKRVDVHKTSGDCTKKLEKWINCKNYPFVTHCSIQKGFKGLCYKSVSNFYALQGHGITVGKIFPTTLNITFFLVLQLIYFTIKVLFAS